MTRREWHVYEERDLIEMWNAGKNGDEIAAALGRSRSGIYCYVAKNHKRLGIRPRGMQPWTAAELRAVAREVETALTRLGYALPHRGRPSITQRMVKYLVHDPKRQKIKAGVARISDLGGMAQATPPGPKRQERAASREVAA